MTGIFWGALSFEDRCVGAFQELIQERHIDHAVFLDYAGESTRNLAAKAARDAHWTELTNLGDRYGVQMERERINPYSMGDLHRWAIARLSQPMNLTLDLTCFSRVHVLAFAQALTGVGAAIDWHIAYTLPLSYGRLDSTSAYVGCRDTLVLPLGLNASLENEGVAIGILALGHQAGCATLAMAEIEPAAGVMIVCCYPGRPDLHRVVYDKNGHLISYLTMLRMPGDAETTLKDYIPSAGWQLAELTLDDGIAGLRAILQPAIHAALALEGPVVLYPFGPKVVVFLIAFAQIQAYADGSWAVYPVPTTHPLDYSEGIGATYTFSGRDISGGLQLSSSSLAD